MSPQRFVCKMAIILLFLMIKGKPNVTLNVVSGPSRSFKRKKDFTILQKKKGEIMANIDRSPYPEELNL